MDALTSPQTYEIVRETWLTRKPRESALLITAGATFLLCCGSLLYEFDLAGARQLMAASGEAVFGAHQHWRLFTTIFAHADFGHLASNSFLFFVLGFFLYGYFGAWLFPVAAVVGGALTNWLVLPSYDPDVSLIGASGVVYWMGGAWLVLYFLLSRQKNVLQRWLRTLGVAILLFMPAESFEPSISYRTHFVGFAVGVVSGSLFYLANRRTYLAAERRETIVEEPEIEEAAEAFGSQLS